MLHSLYFHVILLLVYSFWCTMLFSIRLFSPSLASKWWMFFLLFLHDEIKPIEISVRNNVKYVKIAMQDRAEWRKMETKQPNSPFEQIISINMQYVSRGIFSQRNCSICCSVSSIPWEHFPPSFYITPHHTTSYRIDCLKLLWISRKLIAIDWRKATKFGLKTGEKIGESSEFDA